MGVEAALLCPGPRCRRPAGTEDPYCSKACRDWAVRLLVREVRGAEISLQREVAARIEAWEHRPRDPA